MSQHHVNAPTEKRHKKKSESDVNGSGGKKKRKHALVNGASSDSPAPEGVDLSEEVYEQTQHLEPNINGSAKDGKKRKHAHINDASPVQSSRKKSKSSKDIPDISLQPNSPNVRPASWSLLGKDSRETVEDMSQVPKSGNEGLEKKKKKKRKSEADGLIEGISPDFSLVEKTASPAETAELPRQLNSEVQDSAKKQKKAKEKHVQFEGAPTETWSFQNLGPSNEISKPSHRSELNGVHSPKKSESIPYGPKLKQPNLETPSSKPIPVKQEDTQSSPEPLQQQASTHTSPDVSRPKRTSSTKSAKDSPQEPDPADASLSPFCTQRASLYVPVPSIAMQYAARGVCADALSALVLKYFLPLKGIVLAYDDVQLSPLAKSVDEYADTFLWVTADFLIFRPSRGDRVEGWINIESEGHLGLICWNLWNARIDGGQLPESWNWAEPWAANRRSKAKLKDDGKSQSSNYAAVSDSISDYQGHYEDKEGNQISGTVSFTVEDVEASTSAARERSYLVIEGTMKSESAQPGGGLTNGVSASEAANAIARSRSQLDNPRKKRRRKEYDLEID